MRQMRLVYVDVIKVLAITLVMMCHVPMLFGVNATQEIGLWWVADFVIGAMGVPLFMMCTGALVLRKRFEDFADIKRFYKNNLLSIYVTGALWCLIYYFISSIHSNETITASGIIKTILLINKPEVHLWYIRMVLMYYLAMPFISWLLHKHIGLFVGLVGGVVLLTFGRNCYEIILNRNPCPTTSGLSLTCYLFYLAIGYYLSNDIVCSYVRNKNFMLTLGGVLLFIGLSSSIVFRYMGWYKFIWYDNPFILIASVGFFIIVKKLFAGSSVNRTISELSKMTFGVYLCHMVILIYIMPIILGKLELSGGMEWLFVMSITLVSSFAVVYICHYIPKFSKVLFRY